MLILNFTKIMILIILLIRLKVVYKIQNDNLFFYKNSAIYLIIKAMLFFIMIQMCILNPEHKIVYVLNIFLLIINAIQIYIKRLRIKKFIKKKEINNRKNMSEYILPNLHLQMQFLITKDKAKVLHNILKKTIQHKENYNLKEELIKINKKENILTDDEVTEVNKIIDN